MILITDCLEKGRFPDELNQQMCLLFQEKGENQYNENYTPVRF